GGGDQLLHPQAEAALGHVNLQHLGLHHLAQLEHRVGVLDALRADVADVDHSVHAFGDLDKGAELLQVADFALDHRAGLETGLGVGPGIAQSLLEAERDAAVLPVHTEHHGLDRLAHLDRVLGLADAARPGHLADVDEALDAGLEFDESAEVGGAGDAAVDARAVGIALGHARPGIG